MNVKMGTHKHYNNNWPWATCHSPMDQKCMEMFYFSCQPTCFMFFEGLKRVAHMLIMHSSNLYNCNALVQQCQSHQNEQQTSARPLDLNIIMDFLIHTSTTTCEQFGVTGGRHNSTKNIYEANVPIIIQSSSSVYNSKEVQDQHLYHHIGKMEGRTIEGLRGKVD